MMIVISHNENIQSNKNHKNHTNHADDTLQKNREKIVLQHDKDNDEIDDQSAIITRIVTIVILFLTLNLLFKS